MRLYLQHYATTYGEPDFLIRTSLNKVPPHLKIASLSFACSNITKASRKLLWLWSLPPDTADFTDFVYDDLMRQQQVTKPAILGSKVQIRII